MTDPTGHYGVAGFGFSVTRRAGRWWVSFPGVSGVGAVIEPDGAGMWRFDGGPFHGAAWELSSDGGAIGGLIPVERLDDPPAAVPGAGISPPPIAPDPVRDRAFRELWARADGLIEWTLDHPKHQFVQWLMARDEVVFHGSNRSGITTFRTDRESVEIDDPVGRGNLQAVYATHDGLWACYFAVVDRTRLRGSLRNGVATFRDLEGRREVRYLLSLASVDLAHRPFTTGTLYFLPRARFAPILLYPGGPTSPEWACERPVPPVASLAVAPEEYPLLELIGAHDETTRIEYSQVASEILALATEIMAVDPVLMIRLSASPPPDTAERYVGLGQQAWEGTDRRIAGDVVHITGPERYRHGVVATVSRSIRDNPERRG